MSSGEKFLKRKIKEGANEFTEIKHVNRMHIVNAVALYLQGLNVIPDATDITNIQFSDLFGPSVEEYTDLKVYTRGAKN